MVVLWLTVYRRCVWAGPLSISIRTEYLGRGPNYSKWLTGADEKKRAS